MDVLLPGAWEVESSDFMRYMWYKFASWLISATVTQTTLAKIHVIISFWGSVRCRRPRFYRMGS